MLQKQFRVVQARRVLKSKALNLAWDLIEYYDERRSAKEGDRIDALRQLLTVELAKQQHDSGHVGDRQQDTRPSVVPHESTHPEGAFLDDTEHQGRHHRPASDAAKQRHHQHHHHRGVHYGDQQKAEQPARTKEKEAKRLNYVELPLPDRLTLHTVETMLQHFKEGKLLGPSCAHEIVRRFRHLMETEFKAPLEDVTIPQAGSLTVVGDVHGQLADVLTIFRLNGMPSESRRYIFNGDFVDRGSHGVEVALLLFALKLVDKHSLYLNRGNHECRRMNERYSFEDEVRRKYGPKLYEAMQSAFCLLPLATVVEHRIFITHGGLFREHGVTLDQLKQIDHVQQPPRHSQDLLEQCFEDMLWSDPRSIQGTVESTRGAGVHFGADVTKDFLRRNGLTMLIRSHEVKDKGYEVAHDYSLITVFSASRYCGKRNNFGAFVVFADKSSLTPQFHRFMADDLDLLTAVFNVHELRHETLQQLWECVHKKRDKLRKGFQELAIDEAGAKRTPVRRSSQTIGSSDDESSDGSDAMETRKPSRNQRQGRVSRLGWSKVMCRVMGIRSMPWLLLQPYMVHLGSDGKIDYHRFLARYEIKLNSQFVETWDEILLDEFCRRIYCKTKELVTVFSELDMNDNGQLDLSEFVVAMERCGMGLSAAQTTDLFHALDTNNTDSISFQNFVDRFHITYSNLQRMDEEADAWYWATLGEIGGLLLQDNNSLATIFTEFDRDRSGRLSYKEFSLALRKLELRTRLKKSERYALAQFLDFDKDGTIDYEEFVRGFKVVDKTGDKDWQRRILQRMASALFHNRQSLQSAFRLLDQNNSGTLEVDELKAGLHALQVVDQHVSDLQLSTLFAALDTNHDGHVDYKEFMEAFQMVDTAPLDTPSRAM